MALDLKWLKRLSGFFRLIVVFLAANFVFIIKSLLSVYITKKNDLLFLGIF
jgi:hypothetical protein